MDEGDKTGTGPISEDPLFILFAVTAALGDMAGVLSLALGLALLPFAGLGLVPLILGIAFRQVLGFCVVIYVWVTMKSPNSLIPEGANMGQLLSSVEGAVGLLANPKLLMTSFWTIFPLPLLTLGLFLARTLQSKVVNMIVQQAIIAGVGVATGGAGFALEGAALAETAETAVTVERGVEAAREVGRARQVMQTAGRITETAGETGRMPSDIIRRAPEAKPEISEEAFGMPKENPLLETEEQLFAPLPPQKTAEEEAGMTEEEISKERELEKRLGMSHREVEESLEEVPSEDENTLDLRDAA